MAVIQRVIQGGKSNMNTTLYDIDDTLLEELEKSESALNIGVMGFGRSAVFIIDELESQTIHIIEQNSPTIFEDIKKMDLMFFIIDGKRESLIAGVDMASLCKSSEILTVCVILNHKNSVISENEEENFHNFPADSVINIPIMFRYLAKEVVMSIDTMLNTTDYININFSDISSILEDTGLAVYAEGISDIGDTLNVGARVGAEVCGILAQSVLKGRAKKALFHCSVKEECNMYDLEKAFDVITDFMHPDCEVIYGFNYDKFQKQNFIIKVIASGFGLTQQERQEIKDELQEFKRMEEIERLCFKREWTVDRILYEHRKI